MTTMVASSEVRYSELGVIATIGVASIFLGLMRRMIREERDQLSKDSDGDSVE